MEDVMKKVYRVCLNEEERTLLRGLVRRGQAKDGKKPSALKLTHARILLKADQSPEGPALTDAQVAEAVETSPRTVFNIRKKWVELGIDKVLERRPQSRPSRIPKLDGRAEATIIATSCGPAPQGRAKWTLRLLADKTVELGFADSISPETIRQTLKKTS